MRLISQNGEIDVPYEKVILGICDQNNGQEYVIYAYHDSPRPLFIATYSNTDKALKVMEMLREKYLEYCTARTSEYWFAFNNPKVFKFPADEEVEV